MCYLNCLCSTVLIKSKRNKTLFSQMLGVAVGGTRSQHPARRESIPKRRALPRCTQRQNEAPRRSPKIMRGPLRQLSSQNASAASAYPRLDGDGAKANKTKLFSVMLRKLAVSQTRPMLRELQVEEEEANDGDTGGIAELVALVQQGSDEEKEVAAKGLAKMQFDNADNKVAIAKAGGIAPLVVLIESGTDGQKQYAAAALAMLATHNAENQAAIAKAGGIAPLVVLIQSGTDGQKQYAAAALAMLATSNAENQAAISEAGGIAPLVELVQDGNDWQTENAAVALANLADNDENQV